MRESHRRSRSTLSRITQPPFRYDSVGFDNAILIESIEFSEFKLSEVAGFNLNDKFAGQENNLYWTETEGVEVSHNGGGLEDGATVVTVNTDSASLVKSSIRMTTVGYEKISLTYKLAEAGISKVYVGLTIGVEETIYTYEVAVGEEFQTIELPVTASGDASKLTVSFEGTGVIELQSLRFIMNSANGLDFSVSEQFDYMVKWKWDNGVVAYNAAKSSVDLVARNTNTATAIYYFCNMLKDFNYGSGNIDLTNKSKIVIIYNNMSEVTTLRIAIGLVDVTEGDEWRTAHIEPYSDGSGKAQDVEIETGMAEGEWTALEIDLTLFNTLGGENGTAGRAVNCITFQQLNPNSVDTVNIRAIMFV